MITLGRMAGAGSFVMRVARVGADTLLAQIVAMVGAAQRTRAPIQRLADKVAGWYFVPAVLVAAVVTFVVWAVWGPAPAVCAWVGECGGGADYCLSLRAGVGYADCGDYGWGRGAARARGF